MTPYDAGKLDRLRGGPTLHAKPLSKSHYKHSNLDLEKLELHNWVAVKELIS